MPRVPDAVARFLSGTRFAVAGVSRQPQQAANAVFRKLVAGGYTVYPVNPRAPQVEGVACYPDIASLPEPVDGIVVATHPDVAPDIVRQAADRGVPRLWFHRSFGRGSVSDAAVRLCGDRSMECIVGGCPLMFVEPVDIGHRCMRWWLQRRGRVPR
jgi:predicted CoA-binding protein